MDRRTTVETPGGPPITEPTSELESLRRGALLRSFAETVDDLFTIVDEGARFLWVGARAEQIFGLSASECEGRCAFDFVHPDDREDTRRAFEDWVRGNTATCFRFENRQLSRSGRTTWLSWTIARLVEDAPQRHRVFVSIARDVTERRRLEAESQRREARLRALLSGMLDAMVTIDARGTIREVSNSVESMLGYAPDELLGQNIRQLMPEPYRSAHDGYLARYRETGETWILNTIREFPVVRKDGATIHCELSVSRVDVPGEETPLFLGIFRDVTERRTIAEALSASESRFRAVFDQEYQLVALLDVSGTVLEANQAVLRATGSTRESAVGKHFCATGWWEHDPIVRERLEGWIRSAAHGGFVRSELEFQSPHGTEPRTIDFSIKPVRNDSGRVSVLIAEGRDITEIKRASRRESTMLRALASIGESAAVLAHEIKNPITAVNLALRAVAQQLGEDQKTVLDELVTRMQNLESMIKKTLSFAKPLEIVRAPTDLVAIGASVVELMRPEAEARAIALEFRTAGPSVPARVDETLIREVLANLVKNALEALQDHGHVVVAIESPEEAGAIISVEDDGPGIPADARASVFRPFVTTKATGSGIGLALARKIAEAHGGTLTVSDGALGGARFELSLPLGPGTPPRPTQVRPRGRGQEKG